MCVVLVIVFDSGGMSDTPEFVPIIEIDDEPSDVPSEGCDPAQSQDDQFLGLL